ncbi:MAG: hypothetical protein RSB25_22370, partial [Acinetobacter sp.]
HAFDQHFQAFPVRGIQSTKPIHLLNEQDVTWLCQFQQPKQFRAREHGPTFMLLKPAINLELAFIREVQKRLFSPQGILLFGTGP